MTQPEKHLSQIPALQLLANCGYQVLTPPQNILNTFKAE